METTAATSSTIPAPRSQTPPDEALPRSWHDIPGWFGQVDQRIFTALLEAQAGSEPGTVVELGAFKGKSAVVLGEHLRPGEELVVVDLFGDESLLGSGKADQDNRRETRRSYKGLDREAFERNYRAVRGTLPTVVQGLSTEVVDHVAPGSVRFLHIDASHLYPAVKADCANAELLLRPGGVVAFDDWRNHKAPGVAAAVWESVLLGRLVPVATTPKKLYGVYGDPEPVKAVLRAMVAADPGWFVCEDVDLLDLTVLRLDRRAPEPRAPRVEEAAPDRRRLLRVLADEVAPPALARWVRRRRAARR